MFYAAPPAAYAAPVCSGSGRPITILLNFEAFTIFQCFRKPKWPPTIPAGVLCPAIWIWPPMPAIPHNLSPLAFSNASKCPVDLLLK